MKNQFISILCIVLLTLFQSCTYDSIYESKKSSHEKLETKDRVNFNTPYATNPKMQVELTPELFYITDSDIDYGREYQVPEKRTRSTTSFTRKHKSANCFEEINTDYSNEEQLFLIGTTQEYSLPERICESVSYPVATDDWMLQMGNWEYLPHLGLLFLGTIMVYVYIRLTQL